MNTPRNRPKIAYCTNVHAGANLAQTRVNLERYACRVRQQFRPQDTMGVGLWLSAKAAKSLVSEAVVDEFSAWLAAEGLVPFTFNGFPFGDFHQPIVKQKVYQPTWFDRSRLEYTMDLIQLLHRLAPADWQGSISTLPLAWRQPTPTQEQLAAAAGLFGEIANSLARLESESGRLIYVCIEPEPGCAIQLSGDLIDFFQTHLLRGGNESRIRRHIRVCHDVCHAVVMCEDQRDVFTAYRRAGIEVGKVQISSAVVVDFDQIDPSQRQDAYAQLSSFAEDRYLHQTTIQHGDARPHFFDDLPDALRTVEEPSLAKGTWRVHFHIPVYLSDFGLLKTSQGEIIDCVRHCQDESAVEHFEVETYAWNVLPEELRQADLATGIAQEMQWFSDLAAEYLD